MGRLVAPTVEIVLVETVIDVLGHRQDECSVKTFHKLYAELLTAKGLEWHYRELWFPYRDNLTGQLRKQYVDFTVLDGERTQWVECVQSELMRPTDGRIRLSRAAEEAGATYRGLTVKEVEEIECLHNSSSH